MPKAEGEQPLLAADSLDDSVSVREPEPGPGPEPPPQQPMRQSGGSAVAAAAIMARPGTDMVQLTGCCVFVVLLLQIIAAAVIGIILPAMHIHGCEAWCTARLALLFLGFSVLPVAQRCLVLSVSRQDPIALAAASDAGAAAPLDRTASAGEQGWLTSFQRQLYGLGGLKTIRRVHGDSLSQLEPGTPYCTCLGVSFRELLCLEGRSGSLPSVFADISMIKAARNDVERAAAMLFFRLWVPLVGGLAVCFIASLGHGQRMTRFLAVVLADVLPVLNIAATALLLDSNCAVIRKHTESVLAPYVDPDEAQTGWFTRFLPDTVEREQHLSRQSMSVQKPSVERDDKVEELTEKFRVLAKQLQTTSTHWWWLLCVQILVFWALLGNAVVTLRVSIFVRSAPKMHRTHGQSPTLQPESFAFRPHRTSTACRC